MSSRPGKIYHEGNTDIHLLFAWLGLFVAVNCCDYTGGIEGRKEERKKTEKERKKKRRSKI